MERPVPLLPPFSLCLAAQWRSGRLPLSAKSKTQANQQGGSKPPTAAEVPLRSQAAATHSLRAALTLPQAGAPPPSQRTVTKYLPLGCHTSFFALFFQIQFA